MSMLSMMSMLLNEMAAGDATALSRAPWARRWPWQQLRRPRHLLSPSGVTVRPKNHALLLQ